MKKQLIIGYSILVVGAIQAQDAGHYLHFNAGCGLNNLSYQLQDGTQQARLGYTFNAAYSYFLTPKIGFQTGLGLQSYSAEGTVNYLTTSSETDIMGDPFVLNTSYKNWKERQQAVFLDIPLEFQYRHFFNSKIGLLASAGAKIAIPISTTYKTQSGSITTTGYYKKWNVTLSDLPQYGYTTPTKSFENDYPLKNAYSAIADVGGLYKLSDKADLYVGGYINYGLNNILKPDSKVVYQMDGTYNGLLASAQTDKVIPVSLGLKIGVYLSIGKTKGLKFRYKQIQPVINNQPVDVQKVDSASTAPSTQQPIINVLNNDSIILAKAFAKTDSIAGTVNMKFNFNSKNSISAEQDKLSALSNILKENPGIALDLIGHTCNIGSRESNLKVGMERAETARQLLIKNGAPAVQLRTETKAFDEPLVPNTTRENRQMNRRVEFKPELIPANNQAIEKARAIARDITFKFSFNKINPVEAESEQVKELSNILIANPDIKLKLTGHTCNIGTRTVNLKVGLERAAFIKQLFLKNGVSALQIETASKAFDEPLVPNTSVSNRKKNRRVEVKIIHN